MACSLGFLVSPLVREFPPPLRLETTWTQAKIIRVEHAPASAAVQKKEKIATLLFQPRPNSKRRTGQAGTA
jgi:hypothetical protein